MYANCLYAEIISNHVPMYQINISATYKLDSR